MGTTFTSRSSGWSSRRTSRGTATCARPGRREDPSRKVQAWRGAPLEPEDILFLALESFDGSHPLAVLTARGEAKRL
jgi:hypothetical protein